MPTYYTQKIANLLNTVDEEGLNNPRDRIIVSGNILPSACNFFDIGSSNFRWKDLFLSGNTIDVGGTRLSRNNQGGLDIRDNNGNLTTQTVSTITASNIYIASNGKLDIDGTRLSRNTQGGIDIRDSNGNLSTQTVSTITASNITVAANGNLDIGGTRLSRNTQGGIDIRDSNGVLVSQVVSNITCSNLLITTGGKIDCLTPSNVLSLGSEASQVNIGVGGITKTINIGSATDTVYVQGVTIAPAPAVWFNTSYGAVPDFTKSNVFDGWSPAYTTQSSHNAFNPTTGIFTAPVSGIYSYSFSVRAGSYVWVNVNNNGVRQFYALYGSDIVKLNVNDQLKLLPSGTVTVTSSGWWQRTWFNGVLVQKL